MISWKQVHGPRLGGEGREEGGETKTQHKRAWGGQARQRSLGIPGSWDVPLRAAPSPRDSALDLPMAENCFTY